MQRGVLNAILNDKIDLSFAVNRDFSNLHQ